MVVVKLSEFDYYLPPHLVAQEPVEPRDSSRLLVLHRREGRIQHRRFRDLGEYLGAGDCLVLNDTRVRRARLPGRMEGSGRPVEVLLLRETGPAVWEVLVKPGKKARPGTRLQFGENGELKGEVLPGGSPGVRLLRFEGQGRWEEVMGRLAKVPLPPYIHRPLSDPERYQTVFAREEGSAAAPTAGLHFTPGLLENLASSGVEIQYLTLHIGPGTFRPVRTENIEDHHLHPEYFYIAPEVAAAVDRARQAGKRVVAVGTTVTRALEAVAGEDGRVRSGSGCTDLYIRPGWRFRVVDALITNFHLPRTTLLILVCAFAGREAVMEAYREAVREGYRFYSFGDAMLVI